MARAKIKINKASIKRAAQNRLRKGGSFRKVVEKKAEREFRRRKRRLMNDFNNHAITREIEGGAYSSNVSGTLGGYGNLYSFIGFQKGSSPIDPVRQALDRGVKLQRKPKIRKTAKGQIFEYSISAPSQKELASFAPMPWEPGSWLLRVERGISGLGSYIYERSMNKSRSGTGVQAKGQLNKGVTYKRTTYMSKILRDFVRSRR
jgi:hypothetical protein